MRERASPPRERERKRRWVGRVDPWNGRCSVQQQPTGGGLADLLLSALHHRDNSNREELDRVSGVGGGAARGHEGSSSSRAGWPEIPAALHACRWRRWRWHCAAQVSAT
eukprot:COSAG01_NODE_1768_length_9274_cov_3.118583_3_plen_109_part_00